MPTHEQSRNRNKRILAKADQYTIKQLALIFDVKESTVYNVLRTNKVKPKKKKSNPALTEGNKQIIELLQQGLSAQQVANQLKITRQRVYQVKDKAIELGEFEWTTSHQPPPSKQCPICLKEFTGNNKTCSKICAKQSISRKNTKNSKWSRNTYTTFECANCGQKFQRSNYIKSLRDKSDTDVPTNNYFCSRACNMKFQHAKRRSKS